jgi:predicted PurR-regulated permease PerM
VSFASVILGTSLIGVAGALLAIPVAAMLLSLLDLYRTRYALVPALEQEAEAESGSPPEEPEARPTEGGPG